MSTKVSLGFARLSDNDLDNFAQAVIDAITGNLTFPAPPVGPPGLQAFKDNFTTAIAAAQTGGPADTAAKNNARQALLAAYRNLASYVQIQCAGNLELLLSSGFQAQSTNRASSALAKPAGLAIKNSQTGTLVASVGPVKNTSMYEGRIK